jgi:ABC-type nitrate/sulfonate/bicarbonate transport system permease component
LVKRFQSIISRFSWAALIIAILVLWGIVSYFEIVPSFMLPSPLSVARAFISDFGMLCSHAAYSLGESFIGLAASIAFSFLVAAAMDISGLIKRTVYPLLILTQTVPVIAIAPLLVLWFGYGMLPKIVLIFIVCFFPMAVGLIEGFHSIDGDQVRLLASMGATKRQILFGVKIPSALPEFFSGLKISASYSIIGAVVAEWLGGDAGLGVYMTRVRKSYAFDKMFAVIILVSIISLLLIRLVGFLEKRCIKWKYTEENL